MRLQTIPTLGDDVATDGNGFDFEAFLDSSTGQTLTANILNMYSQSQGTTPIFKNPNGTFTTPTKSIDPLWIVGGAVALGLILYFGKK
jgi:hypothetical protein